MLEFRSNGDFKKFSLRAAPGTDTDDSSKKLVVALYDNEDFIDSKKVTYGKTDGFKDVDISAVSALKIRVWGQSEECRSSDVFAVLYDITAS